MGMLLTTATTWDMRRDYLNRISTYFPLNIVGEFKVSMFEASFSIEVIMVTDMGTLKAFLQNQVSLRRRRPRNVH